MQVHLDGDVPPTTGSLVSSAVPTPSMGASFSTATRTCDLLPELFPRRMSA